MMVVIGQCKKKNKKKQMGGMKLTKESSECYIVSNGCKIEEDRCSETLDAESVQDVPFVTRISPSNVIHQTTKGFPSP